MGRHELDVRSFKFVCEERAQEDGCARYAASALCACGDLLRGSGSTLSSATAQLEDRLYEHIREFLNQDRGEAHRGGAWQPAAPIR